VEPHVDRTRASGATSLARRYRRASLWLDLIDDPLEPREPLPGSLDVDIAVVGAGFTGLWSAYYLKRADPSLRIAVVEREIAGYGASGRNGGCVSPFFPASFEMMAATHGREGALAMQRAMFGTVDEVGAVCLAEGIAADFRRAGYLSVATGPAQVARAREDAAYYRDWGLRDDEMRWLKPAEVRERLEIGDCRGATLTTACAALDPARLVRGLALAVEGLGVPIYERTPVRGIAGTHLTTDAGDVRAEVVLRATEAFTAGLPEAHRQVIPLYTYMAATEPLPARVWRELGWEGREMLSDFHHLYTFAMRSPDDRIVLSGHGSPYHYGSGIGERFDAAPSVQAMIDARLRRTFPAAREARVTHRWGGALGVPRDWYPSVGYDRSRGRAWAGGYVGDGVAASNLAGRTLADLITGRQSELTGLPWVGHRSRDWEPEPLRWLGVRGMVALLDRADGAEDRTGRASRAAAVAHSWLRV
jgi:glycine/D-amino acid oxidase-like deaminating enzyme